MRSHVIHQLEFQQLAQVYQPPRQQVPLQQEQEFQPLVLVQVQEQEQEQEPLQQVQALQPLVLLLLLLQQLSWQVPF